MTTGIGNGSIIKQILTDTQVGPWIFRLLLLCGILWTQLTYVPRATFERFVEQAMRDQEKRTDILSDIKEKIARMDERQRRTEERQQSK